jgi:hypothetical protein
MEILSKLLQHSEEEVKMKRTRRIIRETENSWRDAVDRMKADDIATGFEWHNMSSEKQDRWKRATEVIDEKVDRALKTDLIQEGVNLIPHLMAQWDWCVRRKEESKSPILEQWKIIKQLSDELKLPRNLRPDLPPEENHSHSDMMIVEVWMWDAKANEITSFAEVI